MLPGMRDFVYTIIFRITLFSLEYKKPGRGSVGELPQVFDAHAPPLTGGLRVLLIR